VARGGNTRPPTMFGRDPCHAKELHYAMQGAVEWRMVQAKPKGERQH
jgi:hypothetical protein